MLTVRQCRYIARGRRRSSLAYQLRMWTKKRRQGAMLTKSRSKQLIICLATLTCLLLLGLPSTTLMAEELRRPSAENGLELSQKFCKACHIVNAEGNVTAPVGPPSFPSIANKPGQTAERIIGALVAPHPPMPDMHLTNAEMQDIIAYLDTLRTSEGMPPLLPPTGDAKPKLPNPT